ncbi:hypothetical protein [Protofrankia sp. BMG5.30]|uniref:hypothetical protein n=1 Tax=Protofrankia sp. BMG5.30 TaxID=1834514 RepID=UPI0011158156|nr:hypothetical protein [Protofrankia sp. BMG5.30]
MTGGSHNGDRGEPLVSKSGLRCPEPDAVDVISTHIDAIVYHLARMAEVVITIGPDTFRVSAAKWE